ncbi:MAG: hypothetical protein Q7S12_03070 [bacterium]|nr:hypothetical protein [bacterium]
MTAINPTGFAGFLMLLMLILEESPKVLIAFWYIALLPLPLAVIASFYTDKPELKLFWMLSGFCLVILLTTLITCIKIFLIV